MTDKEIIQALPVAVRIKGIWPDKFYIDGKLLSPEPGQEIGWGGSRVSVPCVQLAHAILRLYVVSETQSLYVAFVAAWLTRLPCTDFDGIYDLRAVFRQSAGEWRLFKEVCYYGDRFN